MRQGTGTQKKNALLGLGVFGFVLAMVGLAYASVPLYQLFCQVTGFGGTPKIVEETTHTVDINRTIKVRFNADVNKKLKWKFKPVQKEIEVALGQQSLAAYVAQNRGDNEVVGTATFNVTPLKAAPYFNKIACFCFTEQKLSPGEEIDMPVSFFVDPAILDDPNTKEIKTITLSYTFFKALEES